MVALFTPTCTSCVVEFPGFGETVGITGGAEGTQGEVHQMDIS